MDYIENNWLLRDFHDEIKFVRNFVNKKKLLKRISNDVALSEDEQTRLLKILEILEFSAIDYWTKFSQLNDDKKIEFQLICQEYFSLGQVIDPPSTPFSKIKFVLKMLCFSYLGEKWEDGKRYIRENRSLWDIDFNDTNNWNEVLFSNIYRAILLLVVKESWDDLTQSIAIIASLKDKQSEGEESYFRATEENHKRVSAYELVALYNLAKSTELLSNFNLNGKPGVSRVSGDLDFHFEQAVKYANFSGNLELELLLKMLQQMFKKMISNSIWRVSEVINSRVSKFVDQITKNSNPVFELLYPQKISILEKGLLDPVNRAIVVNLPTSSGKTLIAEFKILQALNQFGNEGWIAYVVPTRALVNQITARLRNDLSVSPLNIKIEKMSGALELDSFEQEKLKNGAFDILVTTPEKLSLLVRQNIDEKLGKSLVLVVADEAHNLEDADRGLALEILLSTIQNDCSRANFLLLTPFIPNAEQVARWLDPENPRSISIGLEWQPNERVIGMFYPEGNNRNWKVSYKPLITSNQSLSLNDEVLLFDNNLKYDFPISSFTNKKVTAVTANYFKNLGSSLVILGTKQDCWDVAEQLSTYFEQLEVLDEKISILQRYISAELGVGFPLINYLSKGIGIHHAGLPDEIRSLQEHLMEEGLLKVLVATTTVAQGINFPVSSILMGSYSYPFKQMPSRDFWNLVGRAGRVQHQSLGIVGLAIKNKNDNEQILKTTQFVQSRTADLTSTLVEMVNKALSLKTEINLKSLFHIPEWSIFLQYVAHMYRQSENLERFIADSQSIMRKTYGFSLLRENEKRVLLDAVKVYGRELDTHKHLATLSDATGLSPETVGITLGKLNDLDFSQSDWASENLFSSSNNTLKDLVGILLKIPEIKQSLLDIFKEDQYDEDKIAELINHWVSGKSILEISQEIWGATDSKTLSNTVGILYSKISNFATWGLASLQKLPTSGLNYESMSEEDKRKMQNIPSMVCYGVNTDEAILMRSNNVPRSIAIKLGEIFKSQNNDIYSLNSLEVNKWLEQLTDEQWNSAIPRGVEITGSDYKKIWLQLTGNF